jgi:hypothetical protein
MRIYSTNSSSSRVLPDVAILSLSDRILLMYSATVEVPFWVVARWRQMLAVRAHVCDENILSISLHSSADVTLVTT